MHRDSRGLIGLHSDHGSQWHFSVMGREVSKGRQDVIVLSDTITGELFMRGWRAVLVGDFFSFDLVWGSYLFVWLVGKLTFVFVNLTQSRANQGEGITEENASIVWLIGRYAGHFLNC